MTPVNVGVPRETLVDMSRSYEAIQQVQAGASGGRVVKGSTVAQPYSHGYYETTNNIVLTWEG
jgi:hypothetical protein